MLSRLKNFSNKIQLINGKNIIAIFIKNKKFFISLIVVGIVGAVAFSIYKINQKSQQKKYSEMLHQSMIDQQLGDIKKTKEILKQIYESSSAPNGVKSLASMRYAGILLEEGNKSEAVKIYQSVAKCNFCDPYIKELSGLLMVRTITTDEALSNQPDLTKQILEIENNSKILRYYIAEQRGYLEMNKNNLEQSYQIFEMIAKNPDVKENLKNRASDAMKILIQKGYQPKSS